MVTPNLLRQDALTEDAPPQNGEVGNSADSVVAVDPLMNPDFTKRLLEHMHRAKIAALRDLEE